MGDKSDHAAVTGLHEATEAAEVPPESGSHRGSHRAPSVAWSQLLALLLEFVKMTRATAILLIVFVLTLALYMLVRQDPVVAFNSPPRSGSSQTDTTGTDTSGTDVTESTQTSPTDQPTDSTSPSEAPTSTDTSGTGVTPSLGQRGTGSEDGQADDQLQQTTQVPQAPAGSSPQPSQQPQQFEQTQVPVS